MDETASYVTAPSNLYIEVQNSKQQDARRRNYLQENTRPILAKKLRKKL
jgi:hypothetical protein